jgi:hypothetical protein
VEYGIKAGVARNIAEIVDDQGDPEQRNERKKE